jgi:hypothetical protein
LHDANEKRGGWQGKEGLFGSAKERFTTYSSSQKAKKPCKRVLIV